MKTCVMNCGPSTKDMRSRAAIMRECADCEDWPEDPTPRKIEDLQIEVQALRAAIRTTINAIDAGRSKESMRCSLEGYLMDSQKRCPL